MRGEGKFAELIETRFKIACKKFKLNEKPAVPLNTNIFQKQSKNSQQLDLFHILS